MDPELMEKSARQEEQGRRDRRPIACVLDVFFDVADLLADVLDLIF